MCNCIITIKKVYNRRKYIQFIEYKFIRFISYKMFIQNKHIKFSILHFIINIILSISKKKKKENEFLQIIKKITYSFLLKYYILTINDHNQIII